MKVLQWNKTKHLDILFCQNKAECKRALHKCICVSLWDIRTTQIDCTTQIVFLSSTLLDRQLLQTQTYSRTHNISSSILFAFVSYSHPILRHLILNLPFSSIRAHFSGFHIKFICRLACLLLKSGRFVALFSTSSSGGLSSYSCLLVFIHIGIWKSYHKKIDVRDSRLTGCFLALTSLHPGNHILKLKNCSTLVFDVSCLLRGTHKFFF